MAVYAMVHIDVTDADEYAKYAALAGPAVDKFGGELSCVYPFKNK